MKLCHALRSRRLVSLCEFLIMTAALAIAQPAPNRQGVTVIQEADGALVTTAMDTLRLSVCGPTTIHVVASPDGKAKDATPQQPWMVQPCTPAKFTLTVPKEAPADQRQFVATLDTGSLKVLISMQSGNLDFRNEQDEQLLQEFAVTARTYEPATVNGELLDRVADRFSPDADEGLYGLGQHQSGVFNYRGTTIELGQKNTDVAVPLLLSTKGYGIFWNTAAVSYFDDRFMREMTLSSVAAQAIDYYFIYGPEFDQIIHHYRDMTGHAPLFGEWAYGFFQSKDRYKSDEDLLRVANEYRSQHVPLDVIVQDWFWWVRQGDPEYRSDSYPDIAKALEKLHAEHVHTMISVWAVLDPQSRNYQEMKARGFIIPGTTDYDPTNPGARDLYWNNLVGKEFAQGWDAFWLDSSEPEQGLGNGNSDTVLDQTKLYLGNGALYTNIYPLMHTGNVYEHWRAATEKKRVFLLTRSAFAGQQRNAATTWSGDVYSNYLAFQRQIPAGLNFALSGIPYWTTDIAGYAPARSTDDPSYQKLYARWFEFGVFCPIFRTHGHRANDQNEVFSYGPVTTILESYDKLRERLLPYIYSEAWKITSNDSTIMRPLVMDWRTNPKVWNIGDQFMFGPSILVSPVTQEDASDRSLYLPPAPAWYDFWTGERTAGDQRLQVSAPLDRIPLYIKAGSILPMGPEIEYAGEMPDAPIELRVYPGADGHFDLYEDSGDTYDYEKGMHTIIPIDWSDATHTLTIGAHQGVFPGMVQQRIFRLVVVAGNHGVGSAVSTSVDRELRYSGTPVSAIIP
jgi:alpha-D-xyloside xylohydrolase